MQETKISTQMKCKSALGFILVLLIFGIYMNTGLMGQGVRQENPYDELRKIAFETNPEQLGLSLSSEKTIVYGIVMDWAVKNGTASIISFLSGDASIYFSSGRGIIGGGAHENVIIIAKQFIETGQQMVDKAIKTEQTPLPGKNEVVFYLLTNQGIFFGQDSIENFNNQTSQWLGLFLVGNEVINELRIIKEK
jgi:hypothetical protein